MAMFFDGDFTKALQLSREAEGLYDRNAHRNHMLIYGGHDPRVCPYFSAAFLS